MKIGFIDENQSYKWIEQEVVLYEKQRSKGIYSKYDVGKPGSGKPGWGLASRTVKR